MGNGLCVETSSAWTVFDWLDHVLGGVGNFVGFKARHDDDTADRLSHHYTTLMLLVFCIVVSTKQYVGEPIECWCPAQFTDAHVRYTNQLCWISNTYHVPFSDLIPLEDAPKEETEVKYYQWVPYILLFMALLFKIPRILWKVLTSTTTISLDKIVTYVFNIQCATKAEKEERLADIADYLDDWLDIQRLYKEPMCYNLKSKIAKYSCFVCGRRYGNYFMASVLFIKCIYFANALAIFYALNSFLGTDFTLYGVDMVSSLSANDPNALRQAQSPVFPRVTLCDFEIRQMQNVQPWTVQCVLPVNLFNEKIFLFIWFWIVFLIIVAGLSLVRVMWEQLFPQRKVAFIKKFLKLKKVYNGKNNKEKRLLTKFVEDHLKSDGVFVLRIISRNASEILTSDIIERLWKKYQSNFSEMALANGGDY